jgi:hypothetical protein
MVGAGGEGILTPRGVLPATAPMGAAYIVVLFCGRLVILASKALAAVSRRRPAGRFARLSPGLRESPAGPGP